MAIRHIRIGNKQWVLENDYWCYYVNGKFKNWVSEDTAHQAYNLYLKLLKQQRENLYQQQVAVSQPVLQPKKKKKKKFLIF